MSVGEGYRDTWACDDSDKSPRRQNKARLRQICFQCSSVGVLDDGWTGAGRNTSVSELLTIIKTCSFSFHSPRFHSSHLQSHRLHPISSFNLPRSSATAHCFHPSLIPYLTCLPFPHSCPFFFDFLCLASFRASIHPATT